LWRRSGSAVNTSAMLPPHRIAKHGLQELRHWIRLANPRQTEPASVGDLGRRERPRSCWDLGSWVPCWSIFQDCHRQTMTKRRSRMCQRTARGSNSEWIGRMRSARRNQKNEAEMRISQKTRGGIQVTSLGGQMTLSLSREEPRCRYFTTK
jgi:hypothetical protein